MHTRDYSEHTGQIIDDEVERILRAQEDRSLEVLSRHRKGLDAVAKALLEQETIEGSVVGRLVDEAYGQPVHATGKKAPPVFNGNGSGEPTATPADAAEVAEESEPAPADEPAGAHAAAATHQPTPRPMTPSGWPAPQWPPPQWSPPPQPDSGAGDR